MKQILAILLLCAGVTGYGQGQPCVADSCCLEGTIWDEVLGGCVVANVSDTDFDGCVGINDFLVHLSNFGIGCGPEPTWACGDLLEYQGYAYETVQIGEQCWFAENLRTVTYRNGDGVQSGLTASDWSSATEGAACVYGEFSEETSSNLEAFGRLYNWFAVVDERGLCPAGWFVPTDAEWISLEAHIGMDESELFLLESRGDGLGDLLKGEPYWQYQGDALGGTDAFGFGALPAGSRGPNDGVFSNVTVTGSFWTSSVYGEVESDENIFYRRLSSLNSNIWRQYTHPRVGYSVRCIKDTE